ncbi:hypothetical protein HN588_13095 [Candidatus Bathyarchaeota archaeon]|nr:hypothetical protein [Candidatus Bathyarchaeota archaeon]
MQFGQGLQSDGATFDGAEFLAADSGEIDDRHFLLIPVSFIQSACEHAANPDGRASKCIGLVISQGEQGWQMLAQSRNEREPLLLLVGPQDRSGSHMLVVIVISSLTQRCDECFQN